MFNIDLIKNNPLYNVSIVGGIRITNAIYVEDTFDVTGENTYEDSFEQMAQMMSLGGNKLLDAATHAAKITGNQMKFRFLSIPAWVGSTKPVFNLNLLYTSTKGDSPKEVLDQLIDATYPEEVSGVYRPPLAYNSLDGGNALVSVRIGRWFEAHNQLITAFTGSLAKEVWSTSETSIYMNYTVSFTPWVMPTNEEFKSYFK